MEVQGVRATHQGYRHTPKGAFRMSDSTLLTRNTAASRQAGWPAYWAGLLALFVLCQSIGLAVSINVGAPPDEMANISYVQDPIASGPLLPDSADRRTDRKSVVQGKDVSVRVNPGGWRIIK